MPSDVHVHMLPQLIPPGCLDGGVAVIIDVLRASTTIVHALAHGAKGIVPCETVEEAQSIAADYDRRNVLLGGERQGELIEGFDLGNSPFSYSSDVVRDKTIVFTTTNGTQALRMCESASRVLIGAFVNRSAILQVLREETRPVHLVCAGTNGHLTAEDILFAGAVADDLEAATTDVQTQMAIDYFRAHSTDDAHFRETMRTSRGGQNLLRLGLDADIDRASAWDLFDLVPEGRHDENLIVPASTYLI